MRHGGWFILVFSVALMVPAGSVMAQDCSALRAAHGRDNVWTCRVGFEEGSEVGCFMEVDDGFRWIGQRTASASHVRFAECRRGTERIRARDWLNPSRQ